MKTTLYILIVYLTLTVKSNTTDDGKREESIKQLEKQKGSILEQIYTAINESINSLRITNDSDAMEGIQYMKELEDQLAEFNATTFGNNETEDDETTNNKTQLDTYNGTNITDPSGRRLFKVTYNDKNEMMRESLRGIAKTAMKKTKIRKSKMRQGKVDNKREVEMKLNAWLQKKEEERQRIKAYKQRIKSIQVQLETENCPNYGIDAKKKKKGGNKYPCCRKCCKSSYLGCL